MENSVKTTSLHIAAALIAGYVSSIFTLGKIPGLGTNDFLAALFGLVLLYVAGQLCDRLFGKEEKFSTWLWNGIVPFIFIWFVFWTILINYAGIIF